MTHSCDMPEELDFSQALKHPVTATKTYMNAPLQT
jgi:hypothetical protein